MILFTDSSLTKTINKIRKKSKNNQIKYWLNKLFNLLFWFVISLLWNRNDLFLFNLYYRNDCTVLTGQFDLFALKIFVTWPNSSYYITIDITKKYKFNWSIFQIRHSSKSNTDFTCNLASNESTFAYYCYFFEIDHFWPYIVVKVTKNQNFKDIARISGPKGVT